MLVASIHDVSPISLPVVRVMRAALASWGIHRVTLLVVPNLHGRSPLARSPETIAWLRAQRAAGDEIALHGRRHLEVRRVPGARDRWRAALWTAGEGECLAATADELTLMTETGRRELEVLIEGPVAGFVAPAWLEPAGFGETLRRAGFLWHEGRGWIEALGDGQIPDRRGHTPAIGFASRSLPRRVAGLVWARMASRWLRQRPLSQLVRVALHPADWTVPSIVETARLATLRLLDRHPAITTSEGLALLQ